MNISVQDEENKKYVFLVYILQALSFVLGITAVFGIIINYIKDDDMKGTWLESHFLWQKRTFWYGLLWMTLATLTWLFFIGWIAMFIIACWLVYRIARGWIYLVDGKEMYAPG